MLCKNAWHKRFLYSIFGKNIDNVPKKWYNVFGKEGDSMAIRLTKEALDCYVLTCLSIQRMHAAQILKCASKHVNVGTTTLYNALNTLEKEGKIKKKQEVRNGVACEVCSITLAGKKYLDTLLNG